MFLGQNDGIPPFSAFEPHTVDSINLQNLGIQLSAPVMNKAGALPFSFTLNGASSCSAALSWSCGIGIAKGSWLSFVLTGIGPGLAGGYKAISTIQGTFYLCPDGVTWTANESGWVIVDPFGTQHPLPASDYVDQYGCTSNKTIADHTIDGSGLTLSLLAAPTITSGYEYIYDGNGLSTNVNNGVVPWYESDANGNSITTSYNSSYDTLWTDTLGLLALTSHDGGNNDGYGYYKWNDANGNQQEISESFTTSSTIKTNFGCSTILDTNTTGYLLSSVNYPDSSSMGFSYEANSDGTHTGRLGGITLRSGGTITYAYSGGNNGINCTYSVPPTMTRTTQDGKSTYTWSLVNNGSGNYGNTTTVVDNGGNKTIYTFTGLTSSGNAALPVIQPVTQVQHYQGSSTLLTTDVFCYNAASGQPGNCSTAIVSLPVTEVDVYHTINGMANSSRTQTKYDAYGNVTYSAQYDFGQTTPTVTTTTVYGTWSGTTCASISSTIYHKPCTVTTTANGSTVSASRFTYNSHGNLLTTYLSPNGGSSFLSNTTVNSYNSNGTPAATYDLANNKTSYAYLSSSYTSCGSCTNYPFPTSISKGGLATYSTWNGIGGVKLTDKDASGNTTNYGYQNSSGVADPFWRISSIADQYTNTVWNSYYSNSKEVNFSFNSGSSINQVWYDWDGYGRPVNTQKAQSPGGTNYDTVSTLYTWSASPPGYKGVTVSLPCSTGSGSSCSYSTATVTKIDPLGRVYTTKDGGSGLVTNTYSQNDVLSKLSPAPSGENVKQTQKEYDGLGRLTSSCKIEGSGGTSCGQKTGTASGVVTNTSYTSATGSQTVFSTRGVQTRSKKIDGLGRVISSTTPESGTTTYAYDGTACGSSTSYPGHLTSITYPNGTVDCFQYNDANGRMTDSEGLTSSGSGYCKRWRYDSVSNGVAAQPSGSTFANIAGRLVEAETDSTLNCGLPITGMITDEWFSYDKDGHMTDMWELTLHSGQYYHSTATFFGNGSVDVLTLANPATYALTYALDGEGRWDTSISGSTNVVTGVTYNAASQPTVVDLYGTDNDTYTYDPNTGRMTNWDFTVGATSETGALNWNQNGTLNNVAITDGFNSGGTQTCYFNPSGGSTPGYDDLGRLLNDNCGSVWAQTFSYDQYDNLAQSGSVSWGCSTCYNSANNHYNTTSSIYYDTGGNLLSDSFHKYAWDGYNKLASVDISGSNCATGGECLVYDALGRTVEVDSGSTYTEIWYTQLGKTAYMNGSTINYAYWPTPGGGTVEVNGNNVTAYYMHKDWLGNSRISSNVVSHTVVSDQAYAPYGEVYNKLATGAGLPGQMFTGDTQDVIAGMYDTPNREFAGSNQGRWLSPDPVGMGWNRYAYGTNPLSNVDPSGLRTRPICQWCGMPSYTTDYDLYSSLFYGWTAATDNADSSIWVNSGSSSSAPSPEDPGNTGTVTTVQIDEFGNVVPGSEGWSDTNGNSGVPGVQTDYIGFGTLFGLLSTPLTALQNYLNKPLGDTPCVCGTVNDIPVWVTVGRWMSPAELAQMQASGQVVESNLSGVTSVTYPPNPGAYTNAPPGDVYVQFDVPSGSVYPGGEGWGKIYGPSSVPYGEYYGITEMPPAINIEVLP